MGTDRLHHRNATTHPSGSGRLLSKSSCISMKNACPPLGTFTSLASGTSFAIFSYEAGSMSLSSVPVMTSVGAWISLSLSTMSWADAVGRRSLQPFDGPVNVRGPDCELRKREEKDPVEPPVEREAEHGADQIQLARSVLRPPIGLERPHCTTPCVCERRIPTGALGQGECHLCPRPHRGQHLPAGLECPVHRELRRVDLEVARLRNCSVASTRLS